MKGILLLNGEPYFGKIDGDGALVLCCDGAYAWAKGRARIDENIGDFDSLDEIPVPAPTKVYPTEKDMTDGEIALCRLLERGCDEIEVYGGGGKREDHFLGNLHLLYRAAKAGVRATLYTERSMIFPVWERAEFFGKKGKTVSLLPFGGDATLGESAGWKYPLDGVTLTYGSSRGISNIVTESESFFTVTSGMVLAFLNFELE